MPKKKTNINNPAYKELVKNKIISKNYFLFHNKTRDKNMKVYKDNFSKAIFEIIFRKSPLLNNDLSNPISIIKKEGEYVLTFKNKEDLTREFQIYNIMGQKIEFEIISISDNQIIMDIKSSDESIKIIKLNSSSDFLKFK